MAKRPTTPQIRARQKRLLEYIGQTGRTNKQVAKEFGVTPKQLGNFVGTRSSDLRRNFNRSPGYNKLYGEINEKELRSKAKSHGVRIEFRQERAYTERSIQQVRTNRSYTPAYQSQYTITGEQIQALRSGPVTPQQSWARYASDHGLPVQTGSNFSAYKQMLREGRITAAQFAEAHSVWAATYGIDVRSFAEDYYDALDYEGEVA